MIGNLISAAGTALNGKDNGCAIATCPVTRKKKRGRKSAARRRAAHSAKLDISQPLHIAQDSEEKVGDKVHEFSATPCHVINGYLNDKSPSEQALSTSTDQTSQIAIPPSGDIDSGAWKPSTLLRNTIVGNETTIVRLPKRQRNGYTAFFITASSDCHQKQTTVAKLARRCQRSWHSTSGLEGLTSISPHLILAQFESKHKMMMACSKPVTMGNRLGLILAEPTSRRLARAFAFVAPQKHVDVEQLTAGVSAALAAEGQEFDLRYDTGSTEPRFVILFYRPQDILRLYVPGVCCEGDQVQLACFQPVRRMKLCGICRVGHDWDNGVPCPKTCSLASTWPD